MKNMFKLCKKSSVVQWSKKILMALSCLVAFEPQGSCNIPFTRCLSSFPRISPKISDLFQPTAQRLRLELVSLQDWRNHHLKKDKYFFVLLPWVDTKSGMASPNTCQLRTLSGFTLVSPKVVATHHYSNPFQPPIKGLAKYAKVVIAVSVKNRLKWMKLKVLTLWWESKESFFSPSF